MRSSIQVSARLRKKLEKRKTHPRQSYEDVIESALDAGVSAASPLGLPPLPVPPRTLDAIHELRTKLREHYGERLVRVILYGSYARGDARPDSDVDILLVLGGQVDRGREIAHVVEITYDILLRRGVHLSALPMSEADYLSRATPLLMNVRREGLPL